MPPTRMTHEIKTGDDAAYWLRRARQGLVAGEFVSHLSYEFNPTSGVVSARVEVTQVVSVHEPTQAEKDDRDSSNEVM